MRNIIGYHTRLDSDNTKKIVGGSFGGAVDMGTVNRLVSAHFAVTVKGSGRAVFVDREGRQVQLYISIDPDTTEKGTAALKLYRDERYAREAAAEALSAEQQEEIEALLSVLDHREAIRRLTRADDKA